MTIGCSCTYCQECAKEVALLRKVEQAARGVSAAPRSENWAALHKSFAKITALRAGGKR